MLIGEYQHTLDQKGRVFVPSKFRTELGDRFVVTKGLDKCLFVYSLTEWSNLENQMKTLPFTGKEARAFSRFFFAGATECEVDKQGRILIPLNLREHAGLGTDLYIIGVQTRVEVWDKEQWEKYSQDESLNPEIVAESMSQYLNF